MAYRDESNGESSSQNQNDNNNSNNAATGSAPMIAFCSTTATPSGTSVTLRGHVLPGDPSFNVDQIFQQTFPDGISSSPSNDPLLTGLTYGGSEGSFLASLYRDMGILSGSQPMPEVSQISKHLANSQETYETPQNFETTFMVNPVHYPVEGGELSLGDFMRFGEDRQDGAHFPQESCAPSPAPIMAAGFSSMEIFSSQGSEGASDLGFTIRFPDCIGKDWAFVAEKMLMCVKPATLFDAELVFGKKAPPNGSLLKVRAVFETQGSYNQPVTLCKAHALPNAAYLFTDAKGAVSEVDSLIMMLNPPQASSQSKTSPDRDSKLEPKEKPTKRGNVKLEPSSETDGRSVKRKKTEKSKQDPQVPFQPLLAGTVGAPLTRQASIVMPTPDYCKFSKKLGPIECFGVDQQYGQNVDGSYWLVQHARVGPGGHNKMWVDQLVNNGKMANIWCKSFAGQPPIPFTPPVLRISSIDSQGFRTPLPTSSAVATAAKEIGHEITRWLRDVVGTNVISKDAFTEAGFTTLDQVFRLSKTELTKVLGGEVAEESVEKFWMFIKEKSRPPASSPRTRSTEARSANVPVRALESLRKRPK